MIGRQQLLAFLPLKQGHGLLAEIRKGMFLWLGLHSIPCFFILYNSVERAIPNSLAAAERF